MITCYREGEIKRKYLDSLPPIGKFGAFDVNFKSKFLTKNIPCTMDLTWTLSNFSVRTLKCSKCPWSQCHSGCLHFYCCCGDCWTAEAVDTLTLFVSATKISPSNSSTSMFMYPFPCSLLYCAPCSVPHIAQCKIAWKEKLDFVTSCSFFHNA